VRGAGGKKRGRAVEMQMQVDLEAEAGQRLLLRRRWAVGRRAVLGAGSTTETLQESGRRQRAERVQSRTGRVQFGGAGAAEESRTESRLLGFDSEAVLSAVEAPLKCIGERPWQTLHLSPDDAKPVCAADYCSGPCPSVMVFVFARVNLSTRCG
jgi:hypothetical protein